METDAQNKEMKREEYDELIKNASSRYMQDTRKQYLLASNKESLQMLLDSQKEELTRVLIELKSEYDLLTRESNIKKQLIDEYNKKINMIQVANETNEKKQEAQKESTNHIKEGIELKKAKKGEELYQKKTLTKQVEKLMVYINDDAPNKEVTLYHELMHVYLYEYGHNQWHKEFNNEDVCEISASAYPMVREIVEKYLAKERI